MPLYRRAKLRTAARSAMGTAAAVLIGGCSGTLVPNAGAAVRPDKPPVVGPVEVAKQVPADTTINDTTPPAVARHQPFATVRLAFTGDINLGTSTLLDGVPPDSGRGLLDRARSALVGDLIVGNLEGVLADSGTSYKCPPPKPPHRRPNRIRRRPPPIPVLPRAPCYAFLTPTYLAPRLVEAGFTHLNLANNHANDYGIAGRASTETTLGNLGLKLYGPLGHITLDSVRHGDSLTTIALIGFATYPHSYDLLDISRSAAVVDSVRRLADLVIVTFHGGAEGLSAVRVPETAESLGQEPRGELRRWTRAVIDAGADAVIGHGPHVLRGMEFYRGKLIAYSLGNFLTYRGFNLKDALGITGVLQLEFAPDRSLRRATLAPMHQIPLQGVIPDQDSAALPLLRRLSAEDFGPNGAQIGPDGSITPP